MQRRLSVFLGICIVLIPVFILYHNYLEAAEREDSYVSLDVNNPISFGTYPQTLVVDNSLLHELSFLQLDWIYFNDCYSGKDFYGTMQETECMKYADVEYKDNKYRAVVIERYRPESTLSPATSEESLQDDNGFDLNKTYWFLFEPIKWYIVSLDDGFIVSEKILDAMPYNNRLFWIDRNMDGIPNSNTELSATEWFFLPSNLYKTCSVRKWMNNEFYSKAFTKEEQKQVKKKGYRTDESKTKNQYGLLSMNYDKVFLPSLRSVSEPNSSMKQFYPHWNGKLEYAPITDYARCRGAFSEYERNGYYSWQWLCTPGDGAADVISINTKYQLINADRQFYSSCYVGGIRCAAYLKYPDRLIEQTEVNLQ